MGKAQKDIENTQRDLLEAKEVYDEAIALLQKRADGLEDRVINLESAVLELKEAYDSADKALQEEINALNAKIDALVERLEKVEQSQKALVTSIELNAAVNPIFGTFNLPADVRSNVLIGYYGKAVCGGEFPSDDDALYIDANNALTKAELDLVNPSKIYEYKNNDILVNGDDALNIGTLYVTVNPTKADFTGTNFELVNSNNEESLATLGDLQPSNYKIQFGYTRAATTGESENGFYETQVSIAKADVEEATIHSEGMADAMKSVLNGVKTGSGLNIADLAVTILNNMSGITDAYAVRAKWNDPLIGDEDNERSVYSQYGLAAVAMKSFTGYASFKDFNYQTVPGYERATDLINRMAGSIKNQIHKAMPDGLKKGFSIDLPTIKNVKLNRDKLDFEKFGYSIDVTIDFNIDPSEGFLDIVEEGDQAYLQIWAYDEDGTLQEVGLIPFGEIKKNADGTYTITIKGGHYADQFDQQMNEILDAIDDAIDKTTDNIQQAYDAIEDLLDDVNDLLAEMNNIENSFDSGVNKFTSMLQSWLDKVNRRLVNLINSANSRLQPIMVATNANGTRLISGAKNYPTVIPASTDLILTNYTGEILAPALKKYVACTNVIKNGESAQGGNADCKSALTKINDGEDLNKVLDGSVVRISAEGFQAGYTYELTIAALDYEGQQTARKFYVTVK